MPHCIGAQGRKHVRIWCPPKEGSYFFNYKKFHSVVLMALVDHDYKFHWVEVRANGAASDSMIWDDCNLRDAEKPKS